MPNSMCRGACERWHWGLRWISYGATKRCAGWVKMPNWMFRGVRVLGEWKCQIGFSGRMRT
eukprot:8057242-Pyramimonas_sp.AAC.1